MTSVWADERTNAFAHPDADDYAPSREPDAQRAEPSTANMIRTAGDAFAICLSTIEAQISRALAEKAAPNTPIGGDSAARSQFMLLLTDIQQRELFLKIATVQVNWPRLRSLFGAPPYHFLQPNDAAVLNAAGFSHGRVNMTYDQGGRVANQQQFGPGQLVDEYRREYRVAPRSNNAEDPLPGPEYFQQAARDIMLQVKVKKHGIQKKRELFYSDHRAQLFFPQPGETIVLQETKQLLNARGLRQPSRTMLRVKAVWPRGHGASTAAVLVSL